MSRHESNSNFSDLSSDDTNSYKRSQPRRYSSQVLTHPYESEYRTKTSNIRDLRGKGNALRRLRNQLFSSLAGETQDDLDRYKSDFYAGTREEGVYQRFEKRKKNTELFPSSKDRKTWNDDRWNSHLSLMSGETAQISKANDRVKEDIAILLARSTNS